VADDFRAWLIARLAATTYATTYLPEHQLDQAADYLGVTRDVLDAARQLAQKQRAEQGKPLPAGRRRKGSGHYQLDIPFPKELWQPWKDEAERRGVDSSTLLRSMLHTYLLGSWEPSEEPLTKWYWRGRLYSVTLKNYRREKRQMYPYRERVHMTQGARRALIRRANRRGCTMTALARSLILRCMEGTWAPPGSLRIIEARGMFDDEERYYNG
jgi:hypothetical protein